MSGGFLNHKDYCTLISNQEDKDILTRKLFEVNTRLFSSSEQYRDIILSCCDYIQWAAQTEKIGYKKPHGFSGANGGIPFNIIALANGTVMINPIIVETSGERTSLSNCGSLLLTAPILIKRFARVVVNYLEPASTGELITRQVTGYLPTVQHEIDHNNGILITDRKVC